MIYYLNISDFNMKVKKTVDHQVAFNEIIILHYYFQTEF